MLLLPLQALMPRGTDFLCFAKESKQRKATLYLRPASPDALAADNRGGCAQTRSASKTKASASLKQVIAKTPPRLFLARLDTRDLTQLNEVWI